MRLLIDAGNTRVKWQLREGDALVASGAGELVDQAWAASLAPHASQIQRIAVSTVTSEQTREALARQLAELSSASVSFYWSEPSRAGLVNSYRDVTKMGADRWHAMLAGRALTGRGFAVVDAGSAITVDYVAPDGQHLGGYILPGKRMMLRSLQQDAARIGFEAIDASAGLPGQSTTECVQHGLVWLWQGLVRQLAADCEHFGLERIFCTGGDGQALMAAGLSARWEPDLVLRGLAAVDDGAGQ